MLSVGGWAGSGGFYSATTNADGSLNSAGIDTLADSMVATLRQYKFLDGIDIDYEHPTTNNEAGNPAAGRMSAAAAMACGAPPR